jgi:hypothetical protein
MTPEQLEAGYWRAYRDFYTWSAIWRGAAGQDTLKGRARHLAYAGGWKKFEPLWDLIIRARRVNAMLPALERTLDAFVGARRQGDGVGPTVPSEDRGQLDTQGHESPDEVAGPSSEDDDLAIVAE